jgi:hypothetical protein
MEAPNSTESLEKLVKCTAAQSKFIHLLLNHRVQWHMMYCMLQSAQKKESAKLNEMWAMYRLLFEIHSSVEEKEMLPVLTSEAKSVIDKVHGDHEALEKALKEVDDAKDRALENFEEKLKAFAVIYHNHTLMEEKELIPVCQSLDLTKRNQMTLAIKNHFKEQKDGAWLILSMRDVAVFSGDSGLWNLSMPWFFRNIVALFLSSNATYSKYKSLFPAEADDWLPKYVALLSTGS